jgi:hypothetical protein
MRINIKPVDFCHNILAVLPIKEHASEILDLLMNVGGSDLDLSYYDEATDFDKNTA